VSLLIKVRDSSPQGDNVANYMLPEELKVNVSDIHKNSDKLLKMATNCTVTKKSSIKKEDKDGFDINQLLSQSSKKGNVSIPKHKTIVQRAETTRFDFEDAPIATYEVRMHSTKKSKKKTKKKERLESTVPEPPARRYDCAFLARIFDKNRATSVPQGVNSTTATTPIQLSNASQPVKTNVKSQQNTSGAPQTTTPSTLKQKTMMSTSKGPSSSLVGNAVNITPAQPTPVTSQTAAKPILVVKVQHQMGSYYSKLAARKYNHIDSDSDSDSDSDDSRSEENPNRLEPNKITKGEEWSSSEEESSNDESSDEEDVNLAIQRSLRIPVPIPTKKIPHKRVVEDKKPATKKVTDAKKPEVKPKISVNTLYGSKMMSGKVTIKQEKALGKANLIQEFDKEAEGETSKSKESKTSQGYKDKAKSAASSKM
jgi:hypothetical protein